MKLSIYLTVCVFTIVHAVPDQTWSAITKVEDRVDKLEKNNNYKDMEESMEKRFNEMETRFNKMEQNNDKLKQNNNEMATRVLNLTNRMQTMEQNIDELQSENSELRNQIQEQGAEASSSPLISFTAIMTSGQFVPGGDNIVPFDLAITNPGGHYNEATYKFTCPVGGLYFFTFSLWSNMLQGGTDHEICAGSLVMDGVLIVEAYGRHYDTNLQDIKQVSTSAVVFCTKDSEVYVTAPYTNTGIFGGDRTAFSGFIL